MEDFSPGTLQILENGMFSLSFDTGAFQSDDLDVESAFAEADLDGNGYDWEAVLAPAVRDRDASAFKAIEFSPEADTFVAICKSKEPLLLLAEVLRDMVSDQKLLAAAVAAHDPDRT